MAQRIEDYALIGDRRTAALVGTNGSVDWLCLPRFDSPACFAALLGTDDHGYWQFEPLEDYQVTRRYLDDSTVLETTFTTASGTMQLVDLMPHGDGLANVVRVVRGVHGTVEVRHEWRARMDYGAIRPWVRRQHLADGEEVITAIGGPDLLVLRGPRLPHATDHRHSDVFTVEAGDEWVFATHWLPSHRTLGGLGRLEDAATLIDAAVATDVAWIDGACRDVPHAPAVRRSLLTLRLMTHEVTGGIVAAPTTSLPEQLGGARNWDYRYCWLRDAALTLTALLDAGLREEAELWRGWLLRTVAGDPEDLQVLYAVDGARRLPERTLDHLPGYEGSTPVRIGNGAVDQRQLDVLGEVMDALDQMRAQAPNTSGHDPAWPLQRALVEDLSKHWEEPDHGLWEIRGEPRHFTHSRAMVWVAFDRAVRAIERDGRDGPLEKWRTIRDAVRDEVLTRGFNADVGAFTQSYDSTDLDAAVLLLPVYGLIAGDDPRMVSTIEAIEKGLIRDGLVLRYQTSSGVDGLEGDEYPFLACSFWLVEAYAGAGRLQDANALFDRLVGLSNDVGLLAEEYDTRTRRMMGNFPQAFSHLALVRASYALTRA